MQDHASERPQADPLIDAEKLDGFPETSHGFTSKASLANPSQRWFCVRSCLHLLNVLCGHLDNVDQSAAIVCSICLMKVEDRMSHDMHSHGPVC